MKHNIIHALMIIVIFLFYNSLLYSQSLSQAEWEYFKEIAFGSEFGDDSSGIVKFNVPQNIR